MESTKDRGRSLPAGGALCSARCADRGHEPLHQPLKQRACAMPSAVVKILLQALCAAFLVTAAQAQDSEAAGQGNPSRERPVKVLPNDADTAPSGPSLAAAD